MGVQKNVRLVLVGEGAERSKIEQEISRRKFSGYVRMLGLRTDVAQLLQGADIFLLSSLSEGVPLALLEAMAARLPVVSTNVGGVSEVVVNEVTGLLVPAGNDIGLAEAIVLLANNSHLREQWGSAGRCHVEEGFSETQTQAAYQACYDEMLSG
jgi:glycosyltransferase involved in cell wall biosynthesis